MWYLFNKKNEYNLAAVDKQAKSVKPIGLKIARHYINEFKKSCGTLFTVIDKDFIIGSSTSADYSIYLFSRQTHINKASTRGSAIAKSIKPSYELCGFAFLKNLTNVNIYLDLICAKAGIGGKLINLVEYLSKKVFKKKTLWLRAVPVHHLCIFIKVINLKKELIYLI